MSVTMVIPLGDDGDFRYATMLDCQLDAMKELELRLALASPDNLKAMRQYALEKSEDFGQKPRARATWKRIAILLKQELK